MKHILNLKCTICGTEYAVGEVDYVCPKHGDDGILDVVYDYAVIASRITREALAQNPERSIWRYKPLLPVAPEAAVPPLHVGWTPLYPAPRLAERLGLNHVWVKDDGVNPTASFKDRASALAVVKAQAAGADVITTASTGNAAAALAGLAASVGLPAVIFVPKTAPPAKIAQHLVYGARVLLVDGTYDDAFELTLKAAREFGWYNRNTGYNPYMSEGKKTAAYEICEQLDWVAPDRIFVPVGDGCIIGGIHKGFGSVVCKAGKCSRNPLVLSPTASSRDCPVTATRRSPQSAKLAARTWLSATRRFWTPFPSLRVTPASSANQPPPQPTRGWSKPQTRGWSIQTNASCSYSPVLVSRILPTR